MKSDIAILKDSRAQMPTVLGQRSARIPTAGKIRAGIKVLTRRAQDNAHARDIYQRGIEEGRGFDDIERALAQALPDLQQPLVPKNVPYFTARGADFPNPETARQILDLYGEDRGDGVRRLYRFPVVFPADVWQAVMPHDLVCWGAGEKKFWSEYAADGRTRLCKCYAPVPQDRRTARRASRFASSADAARSFSPRTAACATRSCAPNTRRANATCPGVSFSTFRASGRATPLSCGPTACMR